MASELRVERADSGKAFRDFLEVPYLVQGDNPVWVPPLRVQAKALHDEKKHPFYEHARVRRFVAYLKGEPVGRIAAINDEHHRQRHGQKDCIFGFFEAMDLPEVAHALFESAEATAKEWGLTRMLGPFNPSINEEIGLLMNAYDIPPVIMMPYNPPYYPSLLEQQGYGKAMDVYAYKVTQDSFGERVVRLHEKIKKRSGLHFRHMDRKRFWEDAMKVWEVYNTAWENNWSAVPFTKEEFVHLAKDMKSVLDYDLINLAETEDGTLVGFSLALPNVNEAVRKIRNGRLFPTGLPRLLWHTRPGAISSIRIIIMGVVEEYRKRGLDTVFHADNLIVGRRKGYYWGEISWVLETNTMMNRVAEVVGAHRYKTYRVFEKNLA
jgi:GNAT superfamily N-acetyltransferase